MSVSSMGLEYVEIDEDAEDLSNASIEQLVEYLDHEANDLSYGSLFDGYVWGTEHNVPFEALSEAIELCDGLQKKTTDIYPMVVYGVSNQ